MQKHYRLTVKPWPDVHRCLNTTSVCDDQDSRRYVFLPILCILQPYNNFWLQKYERRGRYVKPERSKWAKVKPSMMSDEEVDDEMFKVQREEWRSE